MIPTLFFFFIVATTLVMWRRSRNDTLHGRNVERPTYSVEPPTRRLGNRGRERL